MGKTHMSPGGGAMPSRQDKKMSPENFDFSYVGYSTEDHPQHKKSLRRLLKQTSRKKRRYRDKKAILEINEDT